MTRECIRRARTGNGPRPRGWGIALGACVATTLALLAAACGGEDPGGSGASSSAGASVASAPATRAEGDVTSGLGAPLDVVAIGGTDLADYLVSELGTAPSGEVWAAAVERFGGRYRHGVWHGRPGSPGVFYLLDLPTGGWSDQGKGALATAPDGRVWVVLESSLALATFEGGRWRPVVDAAGDRVWVDGTPAVGADGAVWVLKGAHGLLRYDGTVTEFPGPTCDNTGSGLAPLVAAADGTLWSGGGDWFVSAMWSSWTIVPPCLERFDGSDWSRLTPPGYPGNDWHAVAVAADPSGPVWVALTNIVVGVSVTMALARYDAGEWTTWTEDALKPLGFAPVSSLGARDGILWAVLSSDEPPWDGLFRFDGKISTRVPVHDLPVADVLAAEPDGSVWVTTSDGFLHKVPPPAGA